MLYCSFAVRPDQVPNRLDGGGGNEQLASFGHLISRVRLVSASFSG